MTDYRLTDDTIAYLDRQLIRIFARLRSVLAIDEINVLDEKDRLVRQLRIILRKAFTVMANGVYKESLYSEEKSKGSLSEQWVDELLESLDTQSKFVFSNELERRASKFSEQLMSTDRADWGKIIDKAVRNLSLMLRQQAVRITDEADRKALTDSGEKLVEWVAELDDRTCRVCRLYNGMVYELSNVPPKPHFNCRCKLRGLYDGKQTPVRSY